ncbi:MAG: helix-turn-helix transcriptional regulator, partial [Acidaminococcaceae bacterium]|nr:helix-turn-helix transcriptional regulator [Acidaminococcaceae bacterium]
MTNYVTGNMIRSLREKKGYTQKQLAELLNVSDKTVSKWETQKGLPDISLLEPISKTLSISIAGLLSGEWVINKNRSGNMLRTKFYVCPVCGNVIQALGEGAFSCCGITLP